MRRKVDYEKQVIGMAGSLGIKLNFTPARALLRYRRGKQIFIGQARALAKRRGVVWVFYKASDDDGPRTNSAYIIEGTKEPNVFVLTNGTSGVHEFNVGDRDTDRNDAVDFKCGEGELRLFEAVPL